MQVRYLRKWLSCAVGLLLILNMAALLKISSQEPSIDTVGLVLGTVRSADGAAIVDASVRVTSLDGAPLGEESTDPLGIFEIELGSGYAGSVVVDGRAGSLSGQQIVSVRRDSPTTGVVLVLGPKGPGRVSGSIVSPDSDANHHGRAAVVETRFVESGRSYVARTTTGAFVVDGLPDDGELIVFAMAVDSIEVQGLVATFLSPERPSASADIVLRASRAEPSGESARQDTSGGWIKEGEVRSVAPEEIPR